MVECPLLQGCYTQGKTLDEALKNIHEVIELCLEEQKEEIVALRSSTSCYEEARQTTGDGLEFIQWWRA